MYLCACVRRLHGTAPVSSDQVVRAEHAGVDASFLSRLKAVRSEMLSLTHLSGRVHELEVCERSVGGCTHIYGRA